MKYIIFTIIALYVSACASSPQKIDSLEKYSYKHYEEVMNLAIQRVEENENLSKDQKSSLKEVIIEGFNKNKEIRVEQSKIYQNLNDTLLTNAEDKSKIFKLKERMRVLYKEKYDAFFTTTLKMKDIIGLDSKNKVLMMEINPFMH